MSDAPIAPRERNILEKIFVSPGQDRARAGWRIVLHTLLLFFALACISTILILTLASLGTDMSSNVSYDLFFFLNELTFVISVTVATFLARRFIDRRPIASLGLKINRQMAYDLLTGILIAFVMQGSIFLAELSLGWTKVDGFAWQTQAGPALAAGAGLWLLTFIIGGWSEELLSRGYHLQNLADGLNLFWGVLISSSVFALLHLSNPNASWISTLGILLAGLFLALPYLLTRQLWLSIGLHIGWNFFEGVVFGFPVSGLNTYRLLLHTVSGPLLWTGGEFGPEAGLLVVPALLLGALLVYGYTRLGLRNALSPKTDPS